MTKRRTGEPWMPAAAYGRMLTGLTANLLVRDVGVSLPFYTEVLGLTCLYSDPDFAALEGEGVRLMLHADHTYDRMPIAPWLAEDGRRGTGVELRILGLDPDQTEERARRLGYAVLVPSRAFAHGWRECYVQDRDGYVFAVGVLLE